MIIAGHGRGRYGRFDPGACANGYTENERMKVLCQKMESLSGGKIVAITDHDVYSYGDVVTLAKKHGVQSVTEYHLNAACSSAYGAEVLVKNGLTPDSTDKALLKGLTGLGFYNRGIKYRSDLANMNACANAGIPYRLVEVCFITNTDDINRFNTKLDEIAKGQVEALLGQKLEVSKPVEKKKEEDKRPSIFGLEEGVYEFGSWKEANKYTGFPYPTAGVLVVQRTKNGVRMTWDTIDGRSFIICQVYGHTKGWREVAYMN